MKEAEAKSKDSKSTEKTESSQKSSPSGSKKDFKYGNFYPGKKIPSSGGDGPFKNPVDKWLTFGALGTIGTLVMYMLMDIEKEITWREFVYG